MVFLQINDEGVELPEDLYPTLSDEEVEEEGDEEEHTENIEADLPAPQPISSAAYTIEASQHTSAYVEPTPGPQALDTANKQHEQQDEASPSRAQVEASDPEPRPAPDDPPTPSRKRLIPALVGIALLVVVIIIIIEFLSPRIP